MFLWRNRGFGPVTAKSTGGRRACSSKLQPGALASVNGVPMPRALLRNGDMITLGGVTLRFSLSPIQQSSAALREWLTWIALGALCLGLERKHPIVEGFDGTDWLPGAEFRVPLASVDNPVLTVVPGFVAYPRN